MRIHHVAVLATLFACHRKPTREAIEQSPGAIVQKGDRGTSTWVVKADGRVGAVLKDKDDNAVSTPVTGNVQLGDKSVPVEYDPSTGVLTADGPKLDAEITPVHYTLIVDGSPWNGVIDVPRGGTQDLVETAKQQTALPTNTLGPNGGVVQVVGPDRVEVVANKKDGEVRAYVLDNDNKPVDPGDRKITIALESDQPEVVTLSPDPTAHFVVGHVVTRVDPVQVTVAVNDHGATHACLVGWSPGAVVVVGPAAPPVPLLVDGWGGPRISAGVVVGGAVVDIHPPGVVIGGPDIVVGHEHVDNGLHRGWRDGHGDWHGGDGHGDWHGGDGHGDWHGHDGDGHGHDGDGHGHDGDGHGGNGQGGNGHGHAGGGGHRH